MRWFELPELGIHGWGVLYFGIALVGTWLARGYAVRHRLLDQPGERRSHDSATPRGGGIAIVAALLVAIGWSMLRDPENVPLLSAIAAGLVLVAGVGWADDHRPLSPWLRLALHAVAAVILALGIRHESGSSLAAGCAFILALGLVNVWNFMDGIDGLAASQALLVALGYALMAGHGGLAWLAIALAAACLGFLPFNLPKARIFLGDVGSGALGYMLAVLAMLVAIRDWRVAPALLLPLSAFLIDASLTLATRILRRERWWLPHAEHAYQRWTRRTGRHGVVTMAYAGWTLVAVVAMVAAKTADPVFIMAMVVVGCVAGSAAWVKLQRISLGKARGNRE